MPQKAVRNIQSNQNQIVTETKDILGVWKDYYEETFKETNGNIGENIDETISNRDDQQQTDITMMELENAIRKIKLGKAAGVDNLTPEMIKYSGETAKKWILTLLNQTWNEEKIPKEWENNTIIPIHKKGSTTKCQNYRAICLSSVMFKLYTRIIETRLRQQVQNKLEEEQGAFRPGRQTQDHIFTISNITDKATDTTKMYTWHS